ncbi:hypothetical protein OF83DRAFT_1167850 [Amylostereum chailletii]|nr:hypothetical protein OF83DRAFT_1167850 [Amylostereum chailletii]
MLGYLAFLGAPTATTTSKMTVKVPTVTTVAATSFFAFLLAVAIFGIFQRRVPEWFIFVIQSMGRICKDLWVYTVWASPTDATHQTSGGGAKIVL